MSINKKLETVPDQEVANKVKASEEVFDQKKKHNFTSTKDFSAELGNIKESNQLTRTMTPRSNQHFKSLSLV
jgi:hypothetical protein